MALNKDRKNLKDKPSINIEPINIDTAEGFIYPSPEDQLQLGSKLNGEKKNQEEIYKNESELSNNVPQIEKEESIRTEERQLRKEGGGGWVGVGGVGGGGRGGRGAGGRDALVPYRALVRSIKGGLFIILYVHLLFAISCKTEYNRHLYFIHL